MVQVYSSSAPPVGMLAPPPMLYVVNGPPAWSRGGTGTFTGSSTGNGHKAPLAVLDQMNPLRMTPANAAVMPQVPSMVLAEASCSSGSDNEEDESLSDSSSEAEAESLQRETLRGKAAQPASMAQSSDSGRAPAPILAWKVSLPAGRPLRARPSLLKAKHRCRCMPRKVRVVQRVPLSLSQEERLFVEAAATLARAQTVAQSPRN